MSYRIQETVTCTNCSTAVHADNYILHLSFCSKFISKCPVCQKSILNSDMNSHIHGSQEYIRLAAITNDLIALKEMAEHGHVVNKGTLSGVQINSVELLMALG